MERGDPSGMQGRRDPCSSCFADRCRSLRRRSPSAAPRPRSRRRHDDVARDYVSAHAGKFGVLRADVADLSVLSSYKTSGTGVTHVNLTQRRRRLRRVRQLGDGQRRQRRTDRVRRRQPRGGAAAPARRRRCSTPPRRSGPRRRRSGSTSPTRLQVTRGSAKAGSSVLSGGGISASPIHAKLGWQPADDGKLRLAWRVEIDAVSDAHLWNATVDARTGVAAGLRGPDGARRRGRPRGHADAPHHQPELRPARVRAHHARPGQRRVQLQRDRVPDRELQRRRPGDRDQPGRPPGLAVRLA